MKALLSLLIFALLASTALPADAKVIYKKRSLYRNIEVTDEGDRICLKFATRARPISRQSCRYLDDPDKLVFSYGKLVFTAFLLNPEPRRILVIGLGGGSLPRLMQKLFPESRIDSVEIDPAVVDVAHAYFDFKPRPGDRVIERDGRVFVRRALLAGERYDFILLDAFTGDYIPEHMMTREYLLECRRLLAEGGVLVANTFSSSRLYEHETATYASAFEWFLNLRRRSGNRVIITGNLPEPDMDELLARAGSIDWSAFGINLVENLRLHSPPSQRELEARVLTDEFAPANLLNSGD